MCCSVLRIHNEKRPDAEFAVLYIALIHTESLIIFINFFCSTLLVFVDRTCTMSYSSIRELRTRVTPGITVMANEKNKQFLVSFRALGLFVKIQRHAAAVAAEQDRYSEGRRPRKASMGWTPAAVGADTCGKIATPSTEEKLQVGENTPYRVNAPSAN